MKFSYGDTTEYKAKLDEETYQIDCGVGLVH